jgi:hypothetical protein
MLCTSTPRAAPVLVAIACLTVATGCSSSSGVNAKATTLATGTFPQAMTMDGDNVYMVTTASAEDGTVVVVRMPLAGGAATTLATLGSDQTAGMAMSGSTIVLSENDFSSSSPAGSLLSVPVGGGTTATVAALAGSPGRIACDGADVYVGQSITGTACASPPCLDLLKIPLAGGTVVTLTTAAHTPNAFAFDSADVYWGTSDGYVLKLAKTGGGTPTVLADFAQTSVGAIALNGADLYWSASGGDVYRTPTAGGTSTAIEVSATFVQAAAAWSAGVAWGYDGESTNGGSTSGVAFIPAGGGSTSVLWSSSAESPQLMTASGTTVVLSTTRQNLVKLSW